MQDLYLPLEGVASDDSKPSDHEHEQTASLLRFISETIPFESDAGRKKRGLVLRQLEELLKSWTKRVYLEQGRKETPGGLVQISGSYRLGVNEEDSDIDVICVVPKYVTREQFFDSFARTLEQDPRVTNFSSIAGAFVPIMSFDFSEVSIDLLMARLPTPTIPGNSIDIDSNSIFKGMNSSPKGDDFKTVLSLNGPRVTNILFKMAPNKKVFRQALKFMRHWAKQRGVYSNKTGYLGGVNLAIITCITCTRYPNATVSKVVLKLFEMMAEYDWRKPLELVKRITLPQYQFQVYFHQPVENIMPIITPAYPAMNSTHSVNNTTLAVMLYEFGRAHRISKELMNSDLSKGLNDKGINWATIVSPFKFFSLFSYYLCVTLKAGDEEELESFKGYFHSKFRLLVDQLSHEYEDLIENIRPHPRAFVPGELAVSFFIGFDITNKNFGNQLKLTGAWNDFKRKTLFAHSTFRKTPSMAAEATVYNYDNVPLYLFDNDEMKRQESIQMYLAHIQQEGSFSSPTKGPKPTPSKATPMNMAGLFATPAKGGPNADLLISPSPMLSLLVSPLPGTTPMKPIQMNGTSTSLSLTTPVPGDEKKRSAAELALKSPPLKKSKLLPIKKKRVNLLAGARSSRGRGRRGGIRGRGKGRK